MITDRFTMNGIRWKVRFVDSSSSMLVDRTDRRTIGTTDPKTKTIYLSRELYGDVLMTVFIHELGHCALYSFGFLDRIRNMVYPEYWVEMEEFICNFLADYGMRIFKTAYSIFGYDAWKIIPIEFEKIVA